MANFQSAEDIANAKFCESVEISDADADEVFYKMPKFFNDICSWPTTCNLSCWYCTFALKGAPVFIPSTIREHMHKLEIGVVGVFCTFNCAEAWIIDMYQKNDRWRAQSALRILYFLFTGLRIITIPPSLSKQHMQKYGGEMTISAYVKHNEKITAATIPKTSAPIPAHLRVAEYLQLHNRKCDTARPANSIWATAEAASEVASEPVATVATVADTLDDFIILLD